jgi:dTDP-4-dehydrorhamnose 3,5-epimerase
MEIKVSTTPLSDLLLVRIEPIGDSRGFFIETYHKQAFAEASLNTEFVQDNHSRSVRNVLRGLHYQDMSAPMAKLVRCTRGAIYDVAVDLRVGSPTFGQWFGVELSEDNHQQLYVPVGFAHGFAVLSEIADLQYKCTNYYAPQAEGAIRWDDAEIGIVWPITNPLLSTRDSTAMGLRQYREKPAFAWPVSLVADRVSDQ